MLLQFINTKSAEIELQECYRNEIIDFLRDYVFPHEKLYARCFFIDRRAFDAWSNTPHEGTNTGSKYCEDNVTPTMSQAESTKRLIDQDVARVKAKRRQVLDSYHKTKLYSSSSTVQVLEKPAEDDLQRTQGMAENYASIRTSPLSWLVYHNAPRTTTRDSPQPDFDRVRRVWIDEETGCMYCSCATVPCLEFQTNTWHMLPLTTAPEHFRDSPITTLTCVTTRDTAYSSHYSTIPT